MTLNFLREKPLPLKGSCEIPGAGMIKTDVSGRPQKSRTASCCHSTPARRSIRYFIKILSFLSIAGLSGCSGLRTISPPEPPTAIAIAKTYTDIDTVFASAPFNRDPRTSPQDYVDAGYLTVDRVCTAFFRELTNKAREISYIKSETILGFSTLSTTLALAKNSAQLLAYIAAGAALVEGTIDNTADLILLTKNTTDLERLTLAQMRIYVDLNPSSLATTKFKAVDYVEGYARLCTVDNLERIISESLTGTQAAVGTNAQTQVALLVAQQVQTDLKVTIKLTEVDIQTLYSLLSATDATKRTKAAAPFDRATGIYWDNKGKLTDRGARIKVIIEGLLPTVVTASTAPAARIPAAPIAPVAPTPFSFGPVAPAPVAPGPPVALAPATPFLPPTIVPTGLSPLIAVPMGQGSKTPITVAPKSE